MAGRTSNPNVIKNSTHLKGNKAFNDNKQQTKKIIEAAGLFEIQISDHLIVASDTYFSFADEGIL